MISEKQFQLLQIAYESGGIDIDMCGDVYFHKSSIYDALEDLEEKNMLERDTAPPSTQKQNIFFLTEYGESLVKSQITEISDD